MSLTKQKIIEGALSLLDEVGADALTMRKLATRLDVQAGALYWHYPSKRELMGALAEALLAEPAIVAPTGDWRSQLTARLLALRRSLLAHRDGARVFAGTFVAEPNTLALGEAIVGALRNSGLNPRDAAWAAHGLVHFTLGAVIEEQAAAGAAPVTFTGRLDAVHHQNLSDVAEAFISDDFDGRFRFGLDLMLDGVAVRIGR